MNTWMIRKNSIKHRYLKRIFLQSPKYGRFTYADYALAKRVCKDLKTKNLGKYDL